MVNIRESSETELESFLAMERQPHAKAFINSIDLLTHKRNFSKPDIVYLSIENNSGELAGYFILVSDSEKKEVEFRRIVIDHSQQGIGQIAISEMEIYCGDKLNAERIWLDVYEDNARGKHVYEKLGYKYFRDEIYHGRRLLFYQKLF